MSPSCIKHITHIIKKCIQANYYINLPLPQVNLTPLGAGLPNTCNKRAQVNLNEDNQNTLQIHDGKMTKNNDTFKESSLTSIMSTVALEHEEGGVKWTNGTGIAHGDANYNNRSYKLQLITPTD